MTSNKIVADETTESPFPYDIADVDPVTTSALLKEFTGWFFSAIKFPCG